MVALSYPKLVELPWILAQSILVQLRWNKWHSFSAQQDFSKNGLKVTKKHLHTLKTYDQCLTNFEGQVMEYMPDKTWVELALFIAQDIRLMPHIKNHPDWQVCLTLDGFSSHLVPVCLPPFTAANINVIQGGRGHNAGEPSIWSISGQRRQEVHQRVAWSSPILPKACNHKARDYYCSMYWCTKKSKTRCLGRFIQKGEPAPAL